MRDRFSVVLRVRRVQERLAQVDAVRADAEVRAAGQEHRDRAADHAGRPPVAGALSPLQLRSLQLQGLASYAELAASAAEVERARALAGRASADHAAAAVRRKGAERMVEQRASAAAVVAAGNAQRALDELAVVRWRQP